MAKKRRYLKKAPLPPALKRLSGGRGAKDKGMKFERDCVAVLLAAGVHAEKVPLSGAVKGGSFEGDINVSIGPLEAAVGSSLRKFECKIRQRAWLDLYQWLEGNFGLFIRRDHGEALVVLRLKDFAALHGEIW